MLRILYPNRWLIWTIAIVVIIALFVWYKIQMGIIELDTLSANQRVVTLLQTKPNVSDVDTSNWKTYRNEKYGFEFKYPSYLEKLKEERSNHWSFIGASITLDNTNDDNWPVFSITIQSLEDARKADKLLIQEYIPECKKTCPTGDEPECYPVGCPSIQDAVEAKIWEEANGEYINAKLGDQCKVNTRGSYAWDIQCSYTMANFLIREAIWQFNMEGSAAGKSYEFFKNGHRYLISLKLFPDIMINLTEYDKYLAQDATKRDLTQIIKTFKFFEPKQ